MQKPLCALAGAAMLASAGLFAQPASAIGLPGTQSMQGAIADVDATDNWTAIPADWDSLRTRWEYSHALGAAFQVLAMSALIIAVLGRAHPQA